MLNESSPFYLKVNNTFWLGIFGVLIFISPYFILGQDSVWYANDYLELVVPWYKLLVDQKAVFKPNDFEIMGMIDRLPRGVFASEWYLKTWLFYFLDPYKAIIFNKLLIHLVAFVSAYHFLTKVAGKWLNGPIYLYALIWATLPFWPEAGIGSAFYPTIFYVFYRLEKGCSLRYIDIGLILFYCFYSLLHLHGFFVGLAIFIWGVFNLLKHKKMRWGYWAALGLFTLIYCLFNYRLFSIYFFGRDWFVPHRVEYNMYDFAYYHQDFFGVIWQHLAKGNLHGALFSPLPVIVILVFLIFRLFKGITKWDRRSKLIFNLFLVSFFLAISASLIKFTHFVEEVSFLKQMNTFSYDRYVLFIAPILVLAFNMVVDQIYAKYKWLFYGLVSLVFCYHILVLDDNYRNKFLKPLTGKGEHYPTYREFYAVDQFREIKAFLDGREGGTYKVGSLGLHPAVATYNGLYSIDGYTGNYPLTYKHRFFKVLQNELIPGDEGGLYGHFVGWGNKCYLFNHVQGDNFLRCKWFDRVELENINYDFVGLKELGCKYLLSTDPFVREEKVDLLKEFMNENSAWNIYLYAIK
ncbi:DUF6044 family protein [Echinicola salinicaeni]|uniref:DUF6044 family protein n=1 Tax=Echinicola salinicaeni TaxID=2762757 RepID=UPI001646C982|nr:DUF6044 family protein [Echinicola salinicaeni]